MRGGTDNGRPQGVRASDVGLHIGSSDKQDLQCACLRSVACAANEKARPAAAWYVYAIVRAQL